MGKREDYENRTEKLLAPILDENNFDLYDVEYVKEGSNFYLRTFVDKEGGFTIDDCELVSRTLSDLLDKDDFISDAYILEVGSPGLGRQLKKDRHFEKSIGEEVEVKLYKAIDKQKEWTGVLTGFTGDKITINLDDDKTMDLNRSDIAMVRLKLDF